LNGAPTMRSLYWISRDRRVDAFPPVTDALTEPNGLLAAGGDLAPERLLAAYRKGIFPWYQEGQPILWWSPDPRAVLWTDELRVSRSLRRSLRNRGYEFRIDTQFAAVVAGCAEPRDYGGGTWITAEMAEAYLRLHRLGWAHSFETWADDELVGGLYGVAIGGAFFGESMFTRVTDASKVALVHAVEFLSARGIRIIDCQVASAHTRSLGAVEIPRAEFLSLIAQFCGESARPQTWRSTG
jgi:leucyl/phenylalanyl-tRNA--protein transferase